MATGQFRVEYPATRQPRSKSGFDKQIPPVIPGVQSFVKATPVQCAAFMGLMHRLGSPDADGRLSLTTIQSLLPVGLMKIIARQKGNRRWDLPHEFPLVDSQGILVMCDRRKLTDRRKTHDDLDSLMAILSRISMSHSD